MDVTSLLNSNPAAAEQRKRADSGSSRAPSRNRTPWDAGGYSLPINTATNGTRTPQQQTQPENRNDDAPISTPPTSPKHRFSDSRSSLSSFTSSLQSTTTHSRYSSTSTLNSNSHAHHKSFGTDILSPELRSISQALESGSQPLAIETCHANESPLGTSLSPTSSTLEQLTLIAESHLSEQVSESSSRSNDAMETAATNLAAESNTKSASPNRPGSPSDAILIKRTSIPSLRLNTGDLSGYQQQINYLSAPLDHYQTSYLQNKTHKRTLSAPNFRPSPTSSLISSTTPLNLKASFSPSYDNNLIPTERNCFTMEKPSGPDRVVMDDILAAAKMKVNMASIMDANLSVSTMNVKNSTKLGPMAEPTPPSSQHPDHASPTSPPTYATPNTPPTLAPVVATQTIVCMYIPNCDTGSQMRKAISHIFGRNKMCTRLIPQHVWVHYCRKHYQRSRYRNPKEYAKLQCDLVQNQIRRIHAWSEDNASRGSRSGIVQDWSLAVRKREQKRIDDLERKESNKRKRPVANAEDDDEDEEELGRKPATAVPKWLQDKCHKQRYSTQQVLEIFNELHREILSDNNTNTFPDLEILPNIIVDTEEPKSPKGYAKRSSVPPTHRRSQSLGVVASSQPPVWGDEPSMHDPPSQKRRRPNTDGDDGFAERDFPHFARSRVVQRPMEGGRRMQHLAHRPMYTHMEEHHECREAQPRDGYYPHSPSAFQVPLPAPTPLRNPGYPLATRLENGGDIRRPMHGRSQSEVGPFIHGPPSYARSPSDHLLPNGDVGPYHGKGHPVHHDYGYTPSTSRPPMSDMRQYTPGHGRHQSTPMMHPPYSPPGPAYHQPLPMYAPPHRSPLPPVLRISEGEKTREMYSDRR